MTPESCCTYRQQHDGVLEAVMAGCFRASFGEIPRFCLWSGNNFCVICVISREFGREHRHVLHESCCTYHEQHDGVLEAVMAIPRLSRTLEISLAPGRNCHPRKVFHRKMHENNRPVHHHAADDIGSMLSTSHVGALSRTLEISRK